MTEELKRALLDLAGMYGQYCGDNYGHNHMGAGEHAIETLEKYGLGNERDGIDDEAVERLEEEPCQKN
jgi:hypothetical protein